MSIRDVKKRMRGIMQGALEELTGQDSFWSVFDEAIERELAKSKCLIEFLHGDVHVYIGEDNGNEDTSKTFGISKVGFCADYSDFVPRSAEQLDEAHEELRAIDNFSARIQELRAQIAANIDKSKLP